MFFVFLVFLTFLDKGCQEEQWSWVVHGMAVSIPAALLCLGFRYLEGHRVSRRFPCSQIVLFAPRKCWDYRLGLMGTAFKNVLCSKRVSC